MNTARFFGLALVTFTSLPLLAQQANATVQQSTQADAAGGRVSNSSEANANAGRNGADVNGAARGSAAAKMRPVNAELESKLDAKHAKVGDPVVLKTTERTTTADGTVIPKGTRLVGHVTSVQARGSGNEESHMAIQFDHAELKGGQTMGIQSEIRSIEPPPSVSAFASGSGDDDLGGGALSAGGRTMGGGAMGSGSMGGGGRMGAGGVGGVLGAGGAAASGVANTTGRVGSGIDEGAHDATRATGHAGDDAVSGVGEHAGMGAGAASGLTAHATGVRGVMLAGDASGRASGMLSASKENVHLDSGTVIVLGVAAAR